MNVVWLIVDSLSYGATSFHPDGPDTTPRLADIAENHGRVYERAFSPGPSSPSSHGSFFTNELPSTTGMHEATPIFTSDHETIAGALDRPSYLISTNPFIFNGLDRDFGQVDDLRSTQYIKFPEATDPHKFTQRTDREPGVGRWLSFVFEDGKPVRSLLNGISYKLWMGDRNTSLPQSIDTDDLRYQYANSMNRKIREFLDQQHEDALVVANYMDVHPPFNASEEAIDRFASDEDRGDLPIEVAGQDILEKVREGDERAEELMTKLYYATIWDTDRKLAPFVEELLSEETLVVITADHGNWFRRRAEFETELIHVPLLIFSPDASPGRIGHTVNIRDLPSTTMDALDMANPFRGESLLDVEKDRLSLTESIHEPHGDSPVDAHGGMGDEISHDIAAIRGDARVEYVAGEFERVAGSSDETADLETAIEDVLADGIRSEKREIKYDEQTEQRLEDLGYK